MKHKILEESLRPTAWILLGLLLTASTGCMSSTISSPEQTAVEQLLLSAAAERAIGALQLDACKDKSVFVDGQYLDSYRSEYVTAALRAGLAAAGARLVLHPREADLILEPRVAALSIDGSDTLIGLPEMLIPVPLSGGLTIPEAAVFKKTTQHAVGKLSIYGHDRHQEQQALQLGPAVGTAFYNRWRLLFLISFRTTDLPEK